MRSTVAISRPRKRRPGGQSDRSRPIFRKIS
jgi:hypothetical protein